MRAGFRRLGPGLACAAVVSLAYRDGLRRYFTSEDFLLLRYLGEQPPWADPGGLFLGPWMGTTLVAFYRPVATVLFALEGELFGPWAPGYHGVHVAVHAVNVALVHRFVLGLERRVGAEPGSRWVAVGAALLFGLYPLHPNAVVFVASFATLFATSFWLVSLVAYQRLAGEGGKPAYALSLVAFVLALGSYEVAVVLPLVLLAYELLPGGRGRPVRTLPFWVLAAVYLLLRRAVLGAVLGGYATTSERLLRPDVATLASDLAASILRFHWPVYGGSPSTPAAFLAMAGVAGLAALAWFRLEVDRRPPFLGEWAFSWLWALAAMAPFAFVPVVPGNARYWYLASVGVAVGAVVTTRALLGPSMPAWAPRAAVGALAGVCLVLLSGSMETWVEAGNTARSIQQELVRRHRERPARRIFLTGYPQFLRDARGTPLAQVYHYGLADAASPPFAPVDVPVYPLPPLTGRELDPLLRDLPEAAIHRWVPGQGRVEAVSPRGPGREDPRELEVIEARGPSGTVDLRDPEALRVTIPSGVPGRGGPRRLRLVVVAEGNTSVAPVSPWPVPASPAGSPRPPALTTLPPEFVLAMDHFYGSDIHWWIEVAEAGEVVAASRVRAFRGLVQRR